MKTILSPLKLKRKTVESSGNWDGLDLVVSLPAGWAWEDLKMRQLTRVVASERKAVADVAQKGG
jgi:hypothetical protein